MLSDEDAQQIPGLEQEACRLAAGADADSREWMLILAARSCSLKVIEAFPIKEGFKFKIALSDWARLVAAENAAAILTLLKRGCQAPVSSMVLFEFASQTGDHDLQSHLLSLSLSEHPAVNQILSSKAFQQGDPDFAAQVMRSVLSKEVTAAQHAMTFSLYQNRLDHLILLLLAGVSIGSVPDEVEDPALREMLANSDSQHGRLNLIKAYGTLEEVLADPGRLP